MTFIGGCAALGAHRNSSQCYHLPFKQALWKWSETKRGETTVPVPAPDNTVIGRPKTKTL